MDKVFTGKRKRIDQIIEENEKSFHHKDIDSLFSHLDPVNKKVHSHLDEQNHLGSLKNRFDSIELEILELKKVLSFSEAETKKIILKSFIAFAVLMIFLFVIGLFKINTLDSLSAKKLVEGIRPKVKQAMTKPLTKNIVKRAVTLKFVNLRSNNNPKAKVLAVLPPNSHLEVTQVKGGWHRVKYFDFVKSKAINGWAFYENLKNL